MTLEPLSPLSRMPSAAPAGAGGESASGGAFGGMVAGLLATNGAANANAERAVQDLAAGRSQDLHTASLAVAEADLSFRLILELRNRLTEAFQEVTRMQV